MNTVDGLHRISYPVVIPASLCSPILKMEHGGYSCNGATIILDWSYKNSASIFDVGCSVHRSDSTNLGLESPQGGRGCDPIMQCNRDERTETDCRIALQVLNRTAAKNKS